MPPSISPPRAVDSTFDGRRIEHAEVFMVDLPADLTLVGEGLLEGTATRRPAPPAGVARRRLTFTEDRKFRGMAPTPRHWLRASPDGKQIAFLMQDDAGVVQLWTVSPKGGAPRQLTHNATGIASAFTWSPDGRHIAHVTDQSVFMTDVAADGGLRLTPRSSGAAAPLSLACVFFLDGRHVAFMRNVNRNGAAFAQVFTVSVPHP